MKTAQDPEVDGLLEEAGDEMYDAETLARRPGGFGMAQYHAAQAAEKYLVALAFAAERKVNPMWHLQRLFDEVKDVEGLGAAATAVEVLSLYTTPSKGEGSWNRAHEALRALRCVRKAVLVPLGVEVAEDATFEPAAAEAPAPAPIVDPVAAEKAEALEHVPTTAVGGEAPDLKDEPIPTEFEDQPPAGWKEPGFGEEEHFPADMRQYQSQEEPPRGGGRPSDRGYRGGPGPRRDDRRGPPGRSPQERDTSYVKQFLICSHCGVRLPRTRQTAGGRVPCPHCNRPMTLTR